MRSLENLSSRGANPRPATELRRYRELTGELLLRPLLRTLMGAKDSELPHVLPFTDMAAAQQPELFKPHVLRRACLRAFRRVLVV